MDIKKKLETSPWIDRVQRDHHPQIPLFTEIGEPDANRTCTEDKHSRPAADVRYVEVPIVPIDNSKIKFDTRKAGA